MAARELVVFNEQTAVAGRFESPLASAGDTISQPLTLLGSSGVAEAVKFVITVNQSGTGGYRGVLIDITESVLGSGIALPFDIKVGNVSLVSFDNIGQLALDKAQTFGLTTGITFGAGSTGIFEQANNVLYFRANNTNSFQLSGNLFSGVASGSPAFRNLAASSINPTIAPDQADVDTGLGRAAANQLSLIAGAIEGIRVSNVSSIIIVDFDAGDNAAGNVGSLTSIKSVVATLTATSTPGTTLTASSLIPAGALLIGLSARVTTEFGTGNSMTGMTIGDGSTADLFGTLSALTAGATSDGTTTGWTSAILRYPAANDVVVTAVGGTGYEQGVGVIELIVHYMDVTAPTG